MVAQSCLTFCNPMDCSWPGFSDDGILKARILEWVAIPFSRGSSWPKDQTWVSCTIGRFLIIWATRRRSDLAGEVFHLLVGGRPVNNAYYDWASAYCPFNSVNLCFMYFKLLWVHTPGKGNGHPLQYSCLENSMD